MKNSPGSAVHNSHAMLVVVRHLVFASAALCISGAALSATSCEDGKIIAPVVETAKTAQDLLWHRQFAKLDRLAEQYRTEQSVGADGKPMLMGFFNGIDYSLTNCGDTPSTEAQWKQHQRLLRDWTKASPHSAAAMLASAGFMTTYAWHARGNDFSSTVTDDGFKLFRERIAKARAQYESMGQAERTFPAWYQGMMTVALAQAWEKPEFDALFDEAIKKFPAYHPFYYTKAGFYTAKWHGSDEEFHQVVEEAVLATPTLGETMYARLQASEWEATMFRDGQADWKRMSAGLQRMNQDFPGPWNQNVYARYACMAGDLDTLRKLLGEIGDKVAYPAWGSKRYFEACRDYANTRFCWTGIAGYADGCEPLENVPAKKL